MKPAAYTPWPVMVRFSAGWHGASKLTTTTKGIQCWPGAVLPSYLAVWYWIAVKENWANMWRVSGRAKTGYKAEIILPDWLVLQLRFWGLAYGFTMFWSRAISKSSSTTVNLCITMVWSMLPFLFVSTCDWLIAAGLLQHWIARHVRWRAVNSCMSQLSALTGLEFSTSENNEVRSSVHRKFVS